MWSRPRARRRTLAGAGLRGRARVALLLLLAGCKGSDDASVQSPATGEPAGPPATGCAAQDAQDFIDAIRTGESCVLSCNASCDEAEKPWVCPALRDADVVARDCASCEAAAALQPTQTAGKCVASDPTGAAIAKSSHDAPVVLPDGRRIAAAGVEHVFDDDADQVSGTFPFSAVRVPGTRFVVVADSGINDQLLRVVDVDKLAAGDDPQVSKIVFARPKSLSWGLAFAPDGTLYSASGAPDSVVRAYTIDAAGKLAAAAGKSIPVQNDAAGDAYPSAIAISPDGKRLVVAQVRARSLLVYSLEEATYGQRLADVDVGALDHFAVAFSPGSSDVVYVSGWLGDSLYEVDLASSHVRAIPVGRQPQEIAFLDATHAVVAGSLGDDLSVVDLPTGGVVAQVPVQGADGAPNGSSPGALDVSADGSRLYVTLATRNAVEVFDLTPAAAPGLAPTLKSAGVFPTGWWPTDVVVADGGLVVINGKGHGERGQTEAFGLNAGGSQDAMHGSVQWVPDVTLADLAATSSAWKAANQVGALPGASSVTCPDGAPYDFPVPRTNHDGPSPLIQHIVFVVRENKTFDGVFGDVPGLDGDPKLVLAPGKMDLVWPNLRKVAREFAYGDNFYEDAEASIQGHYWTAFGRTSDYTERTWLTTWGRGTRSSIPNQGVQDDTRPLEGGIFEWLDRGAVPFDNMGEFLDRGLGTDPRYGASGVVSTENTRPDTLSACYVAARARVSCDLRRFSYVYLPNDHAFGAAAGRPNPGVMVAVNDEATGMLVDGLSHSPIWKSTLVVVIEDDPQDGADHVDPHRTFAVFASPWVKRGYVTRTHFDVASLHKLFAHILGLPYNNPTIADAALPFDLFTSTPDFTPYEYAPRAWTDIGCNPAGTQGAKEAAQLGWDFSEPDEQPGLAEQNWRFLHDGVR